MNLCPFSSCSSFLPGRQQHSAYVSRGPRRLSMLSLCVARFSPVPHPMSFIHSGPPDSQVWALLWCSLPELQSWISLQASAEAITGLDSFPFSQGSLPCIACGPMYENCCFLHSSRPFRFSERVFPVPVLKVNVKTIFGGKIFTTMLMIPFKRGEWQISLLGRFCYVLRKTKQNFQQGKIWAQILVLPLWTNYQFFHW